MKLLAHLSFAAVALGLFASAFAANALRQMEKLGRGVIALKIDDHKTFVSWRVLGTDPEALAFNLYRASGSDAPVKLTQRWVFDSNNGTPGNDKYRGQGNHGLSVADVDGDGKDDIIYGACTIGSDGKGLYSTGLGHGDAMHVSVLDPSRPGLQIFDIHENPKHPHGVEMHDARTGEILWSQPGGTEPAPDVGRGLAADIDPRFPGYESWASGRGMNGYWNVKGEKVSDEKPRSCNFKIWWDGDFLCEILDSNRITKWNWLDGTETPLLVAEGCTSNNGTRSTPCLLADLFGDRREEVVLRTTDNKELRIFTTPIPTEHRGYTLMHDPVYRLSVAWQNSAYNQPTHTGFYLGAETKEFPRPNIVLVPSK